MAAEFGGIHRFEVENFLSIRDRQVLDFVVPSIDPSDSYRYIHTPRGYVPKVIGFFGANGSGKSNVLIAMQYLAHFIAHSFDFRPSQNPIPFAFASQECLKQQIRLSVAFSSAIGPNGRQSSERLSSVDPTKVDYEISAIGSNVVHENLSAYGESGEREVWFERDSKGYVFADEKFVHPAILSKMPPVRRNCSTVSFFSQFNIEGVSIIWNQASMIRGNAFQTTPSLSSHVLSAPYIEDRELLKELQHQIDRIDLGINDVNIFLSGTDHDLQFNHAGLDWPLFSANESHGTKMFVYFFPMIQYVLKNGSILLIDEIDQSLHPDIVSEILSWFLNPERNPHNAQLIFSAHDTTLMRHLNRNELFLCEKSADGATIVTGLRQFSDLGDDEPLEVLYRHGAFGAIPRIG
ncbi:MAG: AAA family ATPase [Alphaproteobacteria bacterium]|nr:AAA family ATPase [Alphaproteobacteria bacterium]